MKRFTRAFITIMLTAIGHRAFAGCTSLTSITIPDGVEYIDTDAFDSCNESLRLSYKGQTYDYSQIDEMYAAING